MKVDFWNGYYFEQLYDIVAGEDSFDVKGIYVLDTDNIIINLNAFQWKGLKEKNIIQELNKTITHETIHYILNKEKIKCKKEQEEMICKIMANQN